MYKILSLLFLFNFSVTILAQQDPEAGKILERFTKKTKSLPAFHVKFTIVSENKQTEERAEVKGDILMKNEKYKLSINENVIFFDGKNVYNYYAAANEVSITLPGKSDGDNVLDNPSVLFNIYTKDYKYRLIGETIINKRNCFEIDLYPFDIKRKYSIIKMYIEKSSLELVTARISMKSGIQYTLQINVFNAKTTVTDKEFVFDVKAYKGIEVVDLR